MVDWSFRRRQGWCSACESAFAEGARHVSVLSARGEDLARDDVCSACWEKRVHELDIFWWFTRQSTGRRGLQLDLPTLEQLFVRLEGRVETRMRELRYVLCLLLMRKRRLKLLRMERGEAESMHVRRPRRAETFQVFVFDFGAERMEELRRDLVAIFDGAEPEPEGPSSEALPASEIPPTGELDPVPSLTIERA